MPDGLTGAGLSPMLVTTDAVGGVWRYAIDLAAGMAGKGIWTVLAVLGPGPDPAQRAEAASIPGLRLVPTGLPMDWTADSPAELGRVTAELLQLARDAGVRRIHLHAPSLVGQVGWPAPVVVVAHSCVATWWAAVKGGPLPPDFAWRSEAAAIGLAAAASVIAPSAAHAGALQAAYGSIPVKVVHNGRDPHPKPAARMRAVLTAGRLWDEGKNIAALDRAAPGLDAPIRAAGSTSGPNGASVQLHHLDLLGTLDTDDMARAYAGATVYASMASYEPFGLAVLEAAQAGMQLVLADTPGFRELWDGVARFVDDEANLPAILRAALDDDGDGGARARAVRYTVAAMTRGTLDIHRSAG